MQNLVAESQGSCINRIIIHRITIMLYMVKTWN